MSPEPLRLDLLNNDILLLICYFLDQPLEPSSLGSAPGLAFLQPAPEIPYLQPEPHPLNPSP